MPYGYTREAIQNRTEHEAALLDAVYAWVSTTKLRAFESTENTGLPDRLNDHSHSNMNTHLVTAGSILIYPVYEPQPGNVLWGQAEELSADTAYYHDKEKRVDPFTRYEGYAGPNGCHFVEGHKVLSPTTADRFERRKDIEWIAEPGGPSKKALRQRNWFAQERAEGHLRRDPTPVPYEVLERLYRLGGRT
jgi:hypothetical protein